MQLTADLNYFKPINAGMTKPSTWKRRKPQVVRTKWVNVNMGAYPRRFNEINEECDE
jgi:hypothetical protein